MSTFCVVFIKQCKREAISKNSSVVGFDVICREYIIKDGKVTANTQSALPAIIPDGMKGQVRGTIPSMITYGRKPSAAYR